MVLAATGLKTCADPTAPPLKRFIAGAKTTYCAGYIGANIITTAAWFSPQVKLSASVCCGAAWIALCALEYIDEH